MFTLVLNFTLVLSLSSDKQHWDIMGLKNENKDLLHAARACMSLLGRVRNQFVCDINNKLNSYANDKKKDKAEGDCVRVGKRENHT